MLSSNNVGTGIHDEMNCNSVYQNNTVRNNGGPEFKVVASNGTSVLENVVGGSIVVWHQDRAKSGEGVELEHSHGHQHDIDSFPVFGEQRQLQWLEVWHKLRRTKLNQPTLAESRFARPVPHRSHDGRDRSTRPVPDGSPRTLPIRVEGSIRTAPV
jgi:hypothetical protein